MLDETFSRRQRLNLRMKKLQKIIIGLCLLTICATSGCVIYTRPIPPPLPPPDAPAITYYFDGSTYVTLDGIWFWHGGHWHRR